MADPGVAGKVGPKRSAFIYSAVHNNNTTINPRVYPTPVPCLLPVSLQNVSAPFVPLYNVLTALSFLQSSWEITEAALSTFTGCGRLALTTDSFCWEVT